MIGYHSVKQYRKNNQFYIKGGVGFVMNFQEKTEAAGCPGWEFSA